MNAVRILQTIVAIGVSMFIKRRLSIVNIRPNKYNGIDPNSIFVPSRFPNGTKEYIAIILDISTKLLNESSGESTIARNRQANGPAKCILATSKSVK